MGAFPEPEKGASAWGMAQYRVLEPRQAEEGVHTEGGARYGEGVSELEQV